ncbi:hydroxymethylglutaryl-CoA lyase [Bacteriovorax stolpii]|uniref:Hydroxymethylglutaryl-CoA lyase n=2 Tax=Bacteriovorax stolpii TaxID=960 RepID=A0A2K9NRG4_BACTC|nr:hydroxymethylglutaryl-CoA lyase [Bacteriovorax stolpii]AUN98103.1 hydroxymethylglutaryl-CoA lyase [Bacteriovorax stolpii]QDK41917.1 hydroxymethylglutaryl-CoA lyase [Bacteriovorax stolpii]TDP52015.1 hydroxymethylglutaryl-CoA lyase [Bacteriovorax stolpii]
MLSHMPKKVRIVEVGPRDGLQNEKTIVSLEDKVTFIRMLADAGLSEIEATSFVRAEKIPQMSDGVELYGALVKEASLKKAKLISLVPNDKGLDNALRAGVKEIAVFTATSNTFNQKNINATIDESLKRIDAVMARANKEGLKTRGYISTVFGCPYEGKTSLVELKRVANHLESLGVHEISLGDTIGVANPLQVKETIEFLKSDFSLDFFAMHFHDTRGMAVANILASLEMGMTSFDSSAGGLGGCPYAKGASGNVATEDLVYLFSSMGIETGVNMEKLAQASSFILSKLSKGSSSKSLTAFLANKA